ncbi:hypothetical protein KBD59_04555 [Candidatus Gracilibacteria bacterium]|nr:hypothetical protein [Candidatus Gracilibacteria bacterium]
MIRLLLLIGVSLFGIPLAYAVPPPDFLFNVGSQVAQFFSIIILFLGAGLAAMRQFGQVYFDRFKHKKLVWVVLILVVIGIGLVGAYFYGTYQQDAAYDKWLKESAEQNEVEPSEIDTSLDQLKMDDQVPAVLAAAVLPGKKEEKESRGAMFIRSYYDNLGKGNIEAAYNVSKKSVSLETYKGWYKNITSVTIDSVQQIDEYTFSLRLSLEEGGKITRYAVLMTLEENANGDLNIKTSEVRILAGEDTQEEDTTFVQADANLPLSISNIEFQQVVNQNSDVYVLDAREDEEYGIGRFPGSHHIRFADLLAGEWISVPTDRVVYVFCWSGMRGKEVANFLRTKKVAARYVERGADKWVEEFHGKWEGGIKFTEAYPAEQFQVTFLLGDMKKYIADGVVLVDSRTPARYEQWHIPGSINIPLIYTPTSKIEERLSEVPPGSKVITVCDEFISCFDAKIGGLKLQRKGHQFLGRFNTPWELK